MVSAYQVNFGVLLQRDAKFGLQCQNKSNEARGIVTDNFSKQGHVPDVT